MEGGGGQGGDGHCQFGVVGEIGGRGWRRNLEDCCEGV